MIPVLIATWSNVHISSMLGHENLEAQISEHVDGQSKCTQG